MARNRDDSSPIAAKRRQLEEQERLLTRKRAELKAQLESNGEPEAAARVDAPPVWRMEDEPAQYESEPMRYRHLARQRRRDMIVFFACIAVLLVIIIVLLWFLHFHPATPGGA